MSQSLAASAAAPSSRGLNILASSLQGLLALAFLAAGSAKLAGVPMMVQTFDQIGLGQWFRVVTGLVEIAGAAALLVQGYAAAGAAWLGITMAAAVLTHVLVLQVLVLPTSPAPAVVLLILDVAVALLRRNQFANLLGRAL